jgi:DNA-binding transcriptional ArsR family regulator
MISMEDEKSRHLADVLGNKTAKKILDLLAEKEMSENDISKELGIPINTAEYNLKKLINAGLIETSKAFFWSVKGKKIPVYKISNKYIVIMPKKKTKIAGLFATLIVSGLAAGAIRSYEIMKSPAEDLVKTTAPMLESANIAATANFGSIALWFFGGALFSLLIYLLIQKIVRR